MTLQGPLADIYHRLPPHRKGRHSGCQERVRGREYMFRMGVDDGRHLLRVRAGDGGWGKGRSKG